MRVCLCAALLLAVGCSGAGTDPMSDRLESGVRVILRDDPDSPSEWVTVEPGKLVRVGTGAVVVADESPDPTRLPPKFRPVRVKVADGPEAGFVGMTPRYSVRPLR